MNDDVQVLLIEDSPTDAEFIRQVLGSIADVAPCKLTVCKTLAEGIEFLDANEVALAIVDLHLPDSDGVRSAEVVAAHVNAFTIVVYSGTCDLKKAVAIGKMGIALIPKSGDKRWSPVQLANALSLAVRRRTMARRTATRMETAVETIRDIKTPSRWQDGVR